MHDLSPRLANTTHDSRPTTHDPRSAIPRSTLRTRRGTDKGPGNGKVRQADADPIALAGRGACSSTSTLSIDVCTSGGSISDRSCSCSKLHAPCSMLHDAACLLACLPACLLDFASGRVIIDPVPRREPGKREESFGPRKSKTPPHTPSAPVSFPLKKPLDTPWSREPGRVTIATPPVRVFSHLNTHQANKGAQAFYA